MRTTLDLDDQLLAAARKLAARRGTTLTEIVEEALAGALSIRVKTAEPAWRLRWKSHRGKYIGGVDLADREAIYDAMEGRR